MVEDNYNTSNNTIDNTIEYPPYLNDKNYLQPLEKYETSRYNEDI